MKIAKVLATVLSAGTLFAQAPAQELDSRIQVFGELSRPLAYTIAAGVKDQAGSATGVGIRFMGEIASAHNWYYEIGGRLDSISNLAYNSGPIDFTGVRISSSYWSVGGGYLVPLGSAGSLGFHLEGRGEALSANGTVFTNNVASSQVSASTTYLRPWGRLSLVFTFHMGSLRPYVGVDVAATPLKTVQTAPVNDLSSLDNRTLRSMAPQATGAFYVGLHF